MFLQQYLYDIGMISHLHREMPAGIQANLPGHDKNVQSAYHIRFDTMLQNSRFCLHSTLERIAQNRLKLSLGNFWTLFRKYVLKSNVH